MLKTRITRLWKDVLVAVAFLAPHARRYSRAAILAVAGIVIAFDSDHGNEIGLTWVLVISAVSIFVKDDPQNSIGRLAWWTHVIFAGSTLIGLVFDRLSFESALSLAIALVVLEGIRAALRRDIAFAWGSGALALTMSVLVSVTSTDTRFATGAIGVWAVVFGVFGAINLLDPLVKRGKKVLTRETK